MAAGVRDISSTPFVITEPGHYVVVQNVTMPPAQTQPMITVSAPDVVLDLNGYTLNGSGANTQVIAVLSGMPRVSVRNGFVVNSGSLPAIEVLSADVHIEDIGFLGCAQPIRVLGARARIEGCSIWASDAAPSTENLLDLGADAFVRDTVIHGYTFGTISEPRAAIRTGADVRIEGIAIFDLVSPAAGTGVLHGVLGDRNGSLSDAAFFNFVRTNATGSVRAASLVEGGSMRRVAISAPAAASGWSATEVARISESTSAFSGGYRGAYLITDSVAGGMGFNAYAFDNVRGVRGCVAAHAFVGFSTQDDSANYASIVRSVARDMSYRGFYARGRISELVECLADRVTGSSDIWAFNHSEDTNLRGDVIHCHASNSDQGFRHTRVGLFAGNSATMNATNQFYIGGPVGARGGKFTLLGNNFVLQYPRANFEF